MNLEPLMTRLLSLSLLLSFAGCRCAGASLGPLEDPKPASLPESGLLVDQPAEGETIDAQWVTVSGWVDRSRYAFVAVAGAPSSSFYATTGHAGVPTVPVMVRDDGRFVAARVPLQVGQTELLIIALTPEGTAGAQADRSVKSTTIGTPATILVTPPEGGRASLTVSFEPHTYTKVDNWQWDYDGDGHFDEEKLTGKYTFDEPGSYVVFARTRMNGRWVTTVAPVQVMGDDDITDQSTAVTNPRAVIVVPRKVDPMMSYQAGDAIEKSDPLSFTRAVLVADGDEVKEFDAHLKLVRTFIGLRAPEGAGQDFLGRTYVADTGNNRVVRFGADGLLDSSFADGGALTGVNGQPIVSPTTLLLENGWQQPDGGYEVEFTVATANGMWTCKQLDDCHLDPQKAQRLITTANAFGGRKDSPWFLLNGTLLRENDLLPQAPGDDALDAALGLISYNPWWVVLRPDGRLEEHFSKVSNTRVTRLGFPATALAVDGSADFVLYQRLGEDKSSRVTGPHVIYLAGPNRLERRVLPQMAEGLW